jgi:hypothetical protein
MSIAQAPAPAQRTCQVVYGFVLGFAPNTVLGIEREGGWHLPGGPVEGRGAPGDVSSPELESNGDPVRSAGLAWHVRSAALAWHVKQQTGLDLVRLSEPFQVMISDIEDGIAVTMLYLAQAAGTRTGGTPIESGRIPEFAPICGVSRRQVERYLKGLNPVEMPTLWQKIKSWFHGGR